MIATKYVMTSGIGVSEGRLASFDKALLKAGIGNYNLVRLSSILPAHCINSTLKELRKDVAEGSLLPTAYSTITSELPGEHIASSIGYGLSDDPENVGVIMEYSNKGITADQARAKVQAMLEEAFAARGWTLKETHIVAEDAVAGDEAVTTFAAIAEW